MIILLFIAALLSPGDIPPVETIMSRVAENQTRAQEARRLWIYQQSVLVRLHRSNGNLSREELREYMVTPMPKGTEKKLQHFAGKYEDKGKLHEYSEPGYEHKDLDIDADLAKELAEDLANEENSKDGIAGTTTRVVKRGTSKRAVLNKSAARKPNVTRSSAQRTNGTPGSED